MGNDQIRALMDAYADRIGEWQGVPVPVGDLRIQLCKDHPLTAKVAEAERILGTPPDMNRVCEEDEGREVVVNHWYSRARQANVYLIRDLATGQTHALTEPLSPDQSMKRLTFAISTIGASNAWTLEAEANALVKLGGLLSAQQIRQYMLTGSFLETSQRSKLTYMFRRLRPTIAMSPRNRDPENEHMRCLAVLCLHPVGFYRETWAGCMTPTDDVIAHLLLMRGDEPGFWRQATQHPPSSPEAGL